MDALWHKVSDKEKEEILENAKKVLGEFASKLEKVSAVEGHFSNGEGLREEGEPWKTIEGFKSTMLCNAPDSEDGFIVAEKGGWK